MANFNLENYETVEERIARFYTDNPDGRIITRNLTTIQDRQVSTWVVEATIYLSAIDQAQGLAKATGLAFEIDGAGMAQKTAALETCETSAIGRGLANAGYSGSKRTTREEMAKAERGVTPPAPKPATMTDEERDATVHAIANATTKQQLRDLWAANAELLNITWSNSLGETVSLKNLIMVKQSEVKA
jgi:hypothetical protein